MMDAGWRVIFELIAVSTSSTHDYTMSTRNLNLTVEDQNCVGVPSNILPQPREKRQSPTNTFD